MARKGGDADGEDGEAKAPAAKRPRRAKTMAAPPASPAKRSGDGLPSREEILAFIAGHPGKAGKREIARAFGIAGAARIGLKQLLKDMAEDGVVERRRKTLTRAGALPNVAVLTIVERDADGDFVAEPLEWDAEGRPPRILLVPQRGQPIAPAPGLGDRVLARLAPADGEETDFAYTAKVIKLIERRPAAIIGVLRRTPQGGRIEPVDRKQNEIDVDEEDLGAAKDGDLVEVEVKRFGRSGRARARVLEVVGAMTSEKAVSLIALHVHGIPHIFPAPVLAEAEAAKTAPLTAREDWRTLPLVTIDPADAKDHDDAVHAEPDPDPENPGGFLVTVAIADVSWYVRPGSAMDREALKRGNSVYFPDRVVPMLPERISNDLCSLREGEDRPAIAVRMRFTAEGKKTFHVFHRVMMRSAAKLSYAQAQAAIDGRTDDKTGPLLEPVLRPLWQAYEALKRGRDKRQPLDLDIPERKVIVAPSGAIDRIVVPERLDAHRLIEEFMIQANVAAAETLERRKTPLVYRVHDAPSLAKIEALREFLASLELSLPKSGNLRPGQFNHILARVKGTEHETLVNEVVLRSQSQAVYDPQNIGHFGLNLRRYAHFTSPIRRYADLIVHRALVRSLDLGEGGLPEGIEERLADIATEISGAERRAMAAERETVDRLVAHWLADRIGASFAGRIAGVTKAGLFVKLAETGADGFVPIGSLGQDYYVYDEARHAVIGERTGEMHQLGDAVEVRLVEVAPIAGALRFEMLTEGRRLPKGERKVRTAPGRSRTGGPSRRAGPRRGR